MISMIESLLSATFRWFYKNKNNNTNVNTTKGDSKTEFIKKYLFILTCLNFSHLQSALHLMQYTYLDFFSTAPNSFLELIIVDAFEWFCHCLVSSLPHRQNVALGGLFSSGETNQQKSCSG